MRVIAGTARGRRLKRVPGETTRPIMDRVKENLFNILGPAVAGTRWLDLFAGTGQVGIEALSRGAAAAVFVDNSRAAVVTVRANLRLTGLGDRAQVHQADAFRFLDQAPDLPFDIIYVAPPQYRQLWLVTLRLLDQLPQRWLVPAGRVIVQIDPREFEATDLARLQLADDRRYGNTRLCFYRLAAAGSESVPD